MHLMLSSSKSFGKMSISELDEEDEGVFQGEQSALVWEPLTVVLTHPTRGTDIDRARGMVRPHQRDALPDLFTEYRQFDVGDETFGTFNPSIDMSFRSERSRAGGIYVLKLLCVLRTKTD